MSRKAKKADEVTVANQRTRRDLTEDQVEAIQPFLSRLITRYQEVADEGRTDRPDPICATLHTARKNLSCVDCPVWGVRQPMGRPGEQCSERNTIFVHCEDYYPQRPECVSDDTSSVVTPTTGKNAAENAFKAKAWGWEVVMWLQGLRR
jgi:hypothetical protein